MTISAPPPGLVREVADARKALEVARKALAEWWRCDALRSARRHVEYHEEHGWPEGEEDYKVRLLTTAGGTAAHREKVRRDLQRVGYCFDLTKEKSR